MSDIKSEIKSEIDIELLRLQALAEYERLLQDKSSEYQEGFLAGGRLLLDYTNALYQIRDRMAKKKK